MSFNRKAVKWKEKADCLFDLGEFESAIENYIKAAQIDPNIADASMWNAKGRSLSQQKKDREAIKFFDKAIEIDPKNAFSFYNKGLALHNLRDYEEAIEYYEKAIDLEDDYAWFYVQKAGALMDSGKALADSTLNCINQALEIDPNNSWAWRLKGLVLHDKREYEEAIKYFDKSIELAPTSIVWTDKGNALYFEKRYDDAIVCYESSIDLNPKDAIPWANKGSALNQKGNFRDAIASFDKATHLNPNYFSARTGKAQSCLEIGNFQEVRKCLNSAVRIGRKNIDSLDFDDKLNLSESLILTKRLEEARKLLLTLISDETSERARDVYSQCVMRFLITASYVLEKNSRELGKKLADFIEYCRGLPEGFDISPKWSFRLMTITLRKGGVSTEAQFILLCIADLLQGKINMRQLSIFDSV